MNLTETEVPAVRLTSLSHGAGCACKLSSAELATVLAGLPLADDPRALIDASTRDDAAVYKMDDERAIVATLDFFTPIVDDPYTFGAIAAANAFSDVYAMAATPLFGLSIVAWPRDPEMLKMLNQTMKGATDVAREAGVFVLGGHSIDDAEPKFGMVAIGEVRLDEVISNASAEVGDILVLTKPLGTGIMTTALKRDRVTEEQLKPAVESMSTLNAAAAKVVREHRGAVHAATDVTGFGLIGHLRNILEASGHSAEINGKALPVIPGVRSLIEQEIIPGGTRRNHEAACEYTAWAEDLTMTDQLLMTDAQTSGGLLVAVAPESLESFLNSLSEAETLSQAVIGKIVPRTDKLVIASR
jgi:selenium donor protein